MLKNFIKMALRNLGKNKLISFINIFGLSIAIGCSLFVYTLVNFSFTQDQFHENKDKIFLVQNIVSRDGVEQVWGDSPAPIGEMMKADFPQIDKMVRVDNFNAIFKYDDKVFDEFVRFVDPEFLEMFTFPLAYGNKNVLKDQTKIIISKAIAEKYFGDVNPIGEQVELVINDKKEAFIVGGVAKEFPKTASFSFDILLNFDKKFKLIDDEDPNNWKDFVRATFVQLHNESDIDNLSANMGKYKELQNAVDKDWPAYAYTFEPLNTLSLNSHKIMGDISGGDDPIGRIILSTIAAFLMAIACFNYINISIASTTKRLKEIGVRKVIGGTRKQLILQFLGENLIVCFFALTLGVVWARTVIGPWFDSTFNIDLDLDFYYQPTAWAFFAVILLFTGLGSGAYPAFYISSFKAVNIFRGRLKFGSKNVFTKIFLSFQFVLSIITIVFGIAFVQNADFLKDRDWGYNKENTLVLVVDNEQTYSAIHNELQGNSNVNKMAGSSLHLGRAVATSVIDYHDKKYEIRRIDVGYDYLELFDVPLKEGRFFDRSLKTDLQESVVINQEMVDNMEWDNPIGETFSVDTLKYTVIGVIDNIHQTDFNNVIQPFFIRMSPEEKFRFLSVNYKEGKKDEVEATAKELWKKHAPDTPYNAFFQANVFDQYFKQIENHGKIMGFTALLAIVLSCLGLYGLVSLNIASKLKEFSIRKVLGAGLMNIFKGVNKQFMGLIFIACLIGLPISFVMVNGLFDQVYKYHMPLTASPLIMATGFILLAALITVSTQIYKVATSNPVDALRNE